MKVRITRERLLASTIIGGAALMALAATPAAAQSAAQQPETTQLDEIVVTGTRIPQTNLVTTSPVTQVTGEDIDIAGVTRVEDLVNQLPQAFAAQNSTVANGATGTATVSLRNLGSSRTLVLIDGRRMGYGSPNDDAADLNLIPGQLVERVEILTGGASAVYGSDAVAGVANFIMRKDFEGIQLDAQYGFYQHNNDYDGVGNLRDVITRRAQTNPSQFQLPDDNVVDGESREVTIVMGINAPDGRGNLTAYAGYRNNNSVLGADRDYSACSLGGSSGDEFTCGGSGTSFPGQFISLATGGVFTVSGAGAPGTGTFIPYNANVNAYNFGPLNYFQRPDERYVLGAFGNYQINDRVEAFAQLMFADYSSVAQIAPSGVFGNTSSINCDNPLLSAQQRTAIGCSAAQIAAGDSVGFIPLRRNVEGGGRQDSIGYESYRMVGGVRGEFAPGWNYDLAAQWSRVHLARTYLNDFSVQRVTRALDVVTDPTTGAAVCRSVLNGTDPNCVPYNIFTTDGVTQAALDYVQIPLVQTGETTQQVITAAITGDLGQYGWQTPWASRGVQVAFGGEYRRDALDTVTDTAFATGDGAGQGGPTIGFEGSIDTSDVFAELQIPIAEGQAWADFASIDAAFRHSSYSTGITTNTYKVGADYAPVQDIRFRASYARAVRAPNVIELFAAQGFNLFDMDFDPCDAVNRPSTAGAVPASCIGTNPWQVTSGESNSGLLNSPAGQYNFLGGGNPNLQPEESDTYTAGFVFSPSALPGFNLSVDWFKIEVDQLISAIGAANILSACYDANLQSACDFIDRDPATGSLWLTDGNIVDLNTNIGGVRTSGIDINANYGLDLADFGRDAWGQLAFNFVGTYLHELEIDTGLGFANSVYDCAGFYGNQCSDRGSITATPNPEWRHRFRVTWVSPWAVDVSATWRHIGEVEIAVLGEDGGLNNGGSRIDRVFDAENYLDLAATWQVRDTLRFRAGINNVLDDDPQLSYSVGTTGNNNTYPQLYDSMGRYWFFGLTADF